MVKWKKRKHINFQIEVNSLVNISIIKEGNGKFTWPECLKVNLAWIFHRNEEIEVVGFNQGKIISHFRNLKLKYHTLL